MRLNNITCYKEWRCRRHRCAYSKMGYSVEIYSVGKAGLKTDDAIIRVKIVNFIVEKGSPFCS